AIIAEEGLQELSLSSIEQRAGMSRGQLTYYFHTKEDILLAVFDHMIDMMRKSAPAEKGCQGRGLPPAGWERLRAFRELFALGLLGGYLGKNEPAPAKKKPSRRSTKAGDT